MGYAIYLAQCGQKHVSAKPLKGLGSGVLEVVSDHLTEGIRFVRCIPFDSAAACLCCTGSRRKSKSGVMTPKADIDLIWQRLKQAVTLSKRKD